MIELENEEPVLNGFGSSGRMIGSFGEKVKSGVSSAQLYHVFLLKQVFLECPLPSLSSLLENPRIRDTDSLVISIQIHWPVGPSIPQQPSVYYVPKDLLEGLEASLDNPSKYSCKSMLTSLIHSIDTGDVRFVCLERYTDPEDPLAPGAPTEQSSASGSTSPFGGYATARKRIIYAHSDILTRRSEYFATMLSSSFAENPAAANGERKLYTVVVEEADFETIYWLLKYCYANWLLFRQHDDPRAAVEGVGAGWSVRWLNEQRGEWDWKTFHKGGPSDDSRSAASGESLAMSHSTSTKSETYPNPVPTTPNAAGPSTTISSPTKSTMNANSISRPTQSTSSTVRRTSASTTASPVTLNVGGPSSNIPRAKPVPITPASNFSTPSRYSASPRSSRQGPMASAPDPHPHPTPAPGPASALAIYQVAHRYGMPTLATLALEHVMSTITPQSSFALLLATSLWDELRSLIEVCLDNYFSPLKSKILVGLRGGSVGRGFHLTRIRAVL